MTRALLLLAVLMQSGCVVGGAIYAESRKVTREGLAPAVARAAPEAENEAATTCILKGLTQVEIVGLPNSGRLDDPARADALVREVLARPGVSDCIAAAPRAAG